MDLGRVEIDIAVGTWLQAAASSATVRIQMITPAIVAEMNRLPAGFQHDPADHLIVATARSLKLPLATHPRKIRVAKGVPWRKP